MNIRSLRFNLFKENTYVVWTDNKAAVIIDPGFLEDGENDTFFTYLEREGITPAAVMLTHAHFDHIGGVAEIQRRFSVPVYMHPDEKVILDYNKQTAGKYLKKSPDNSFNTTDIADAQTISVGGIDFEVISTPGHTPGGVCYRVAKHNVLFTGDTLFAGSIGRTDLLYSDYDKEIVSIMEKLLWLPAETEVFPGHGASSTIGTERTENPFLEPFNEPEEGTSAEDITPVSLTSHLSDN